MLIALIVACLYCPLIAFLYWQAEKEAELWHKKWCEEKDAQERLHHELILTQIRLEDAERKLNGRK